MARKEVIYVIFVGCQLGIYISWLECQQQVVGYRGNVYKSYKSIEEARTAWIMYVSHYKRERSTSIGSDEQVTSHNAIAPNFENDGRMKRMNDFNFITTFFMECVVTLVVMWIIPTFM